MDNFEKYLEALAEHEEEKARPYLTPRERLLINAGYRLNWIGDFIANHGIEFRLEEVETASFIFTGTTPDWNRILLDKCRRSVEEFCSLIEADSRVREKFEQEASFGKEPVLARGPDDNGKYRLIDGMHRLVGAILEGRTKIDAYVANEKKEVLPHCEAHTIYDLIRGFQRHANDGQGKTDLYHALRLLSRTYGNVIDLLENRFNPTYINDDKVQEIIKRVLDEANG